METNQMETNQRMTYEQNKAANSWIDITSTATLKELQIAENFKSSFTVQMRRKITFAINSREGKHKYHSPAAERARLLGQLLYFALGAHGLMRAASNTLYQKKASTDLDQWDLMYLRESITNAAQVLNVLVTRINSVAARSIKSKKEKEE